MKFDEKINEARKYLLDIERQFKKEVNTDREDYWQGRKDSARIMFGIFNESYADSANRLIGTSPGYIPTDNEIVQEWIVDALYNISAIIYELEYEKKPHWQTKINLKQLVQRYEHLSNQDGLFSKIDDHCLAED